MLFMMLNVRSSCSALELCRLSELGRAALHGGDVDGIVLSNENRTIMTASGPDAPAAMAASATLLAHVFGVSLRRSECFTRLVTVESDRYCHTSAVAMTRK